MNIKRRKLIEEARSLLATAKDMLQSAHDDEEEAFMNLPESMQEGERGETMQGHVDALSEIIEAIEEFEGHEL
jgi:riboflavin synthase alpha subunit